MYRLILLLTLYISSFALSASTITPPEVSKWFEGQRVYAVHVTDIPPQKLSGGYKLRSGGVKASKFKLTKPITEEIFLWHNFCPSRPSIHWTIGGYVPRSNHVLTLEDGRELVIRKPRKYIILEPLEKLFPSIYGGFWSDLLTIGDHELSSEAIVVTTDRNFDFPKGRLVLIPSLLKKRDEVSAFVDTYLFETLQSVTQRPRITEEAVKEDEKVFAFQSFQDKETRYFSVLDCENFLKARGVAVVESGAHEFMDLHTFEKNINELYTHFPNMLTLDLLCNKGEKLPPEVLGDVWTLLNHQMRFVLKKLQKRPLLKQRLSSFFYKVLIPSLEDRLQYESLEDFFLNNFPGEVQSCVLFKEYFLDRDPLSKKVRVSSPRGELSLYSYLLLLSEKSLQEKHRRSSMLLSWEEVQASYQAQMTAPIRLVRRQREERLVKIFDIKNHR